MLNLFIDPVSLDLDIFRIKQGIVHYCCRCLGLGRCRLLGEGSSVVELVDDLVPWSNPRDLDVCDGRVMFCFLWMARYWVLRLVCLPCRVFLLLVISWGLCWGILPLVGCDVL